MKMRMIPLGYYFLSDILLDLTWRYVNYDLSENCKSLPEKEEFRNGFILEKKFAASYSIQQGLLDEMMIAYFTDAVDINRIPRGFWRDKVGNDAILSGMTAPIISIEEEWIYVEQNKYIEFLNFMDVQDVPGRHGVLSSRFQGRDVLNRRSMQEDDIPRAVDLLRQEILTRSLTREEREIFVRQNFPDIDIKEREMRSILKEVPAPRGRPRKGVSTSK